MNIPLIVKLYLEKTNFFFQNLFSYYSDLFFLTQIPLLLFNGVSNGIDIIKVEKRPEKKRNLKRLRVL